MEVKIHRDEFAKSIGLVAPIVPSQPSLFVLTNMLIEADTKGYISLSATDLDISMRVKKEALVEEKGNAILPAKKIFDVVRELPQQMINMRREEDKLIIDCGRGHFELQTFPGEDFPSIPKLKYEEALRIDGKTLLKGIERTMYAMSRDQSRPILTGVLMELREDFIGIVATDGHRLARFRKMGEFQEAGSERDLIIPMKALNQIKRLFEETEDIEIAVSEKQIGLRADGKEIYTRLIEGPYPNYELVIPRDNDKVACINTKEMIKATRRMLVISNPMTRRVNYEFLSGRLNMNVSTRDVGEAHDEIDIEYEDEEIEISFNAGYVEEALKSIECERMILMMKESDKACIVKPEEIEDDEEYFSIIMPLMTVEGEM
ncbi:MAG: DNA polymerase III subunit beta [Candidatus Glassbacteria bacterium]